MGAVARRFSRHQGNSLKRYGGSLAPDDGGAAQLWCDHPCRGHPDRTRNRKSFVPGNGDEFRGKYGIAQHRPMLLFVGRVAHEKNIGFLLQVVDRVRKDIPEVLLLIAGAGPAREGLEHDAEKLALFGNIMFIRLPRPPYRTQ